MIEPIVSTVDVVDRAFWLNAANQAVRSECGWHVAPVITETLTLDGNGGSVLLLPSKRVKTLISVINDGVDVTAQVDHSRAGILELASGWTSRLGKVIISLEHGYEFVDVPDVAGVVAALAARSSVIPAGIAAQNIGPAGVKYGTAPMLESEKAALAPYKLNWGA